MTAADFYNTSCAAIFATMRDQIAQGRPCGPASIRSALRTQGEQSGIQPAESIR
ncbi:DnaB-like helicase N-terminal domain-containing protein [Corynebacterium tuberculostearicum]|uniref:DnaB-like helicase N-terminal domain-containing protein n=1 Tax=Corynebacterium striatum TaxID=43770 RepID=UPI00352216DB